MRNCLLCLLYCVVALSAGAAPVTFEEVSLLVRVHESEPAIVQTVSQRRLLRALTPAQEAALKRAGAEESLLVALRRPELIALPEEAAAFEAWKEQVAAKQRAAAAEPTVRPQKSLLPRPEGPKLVIDRLIMKRHPIPPPYFVYLRAKADRAEAVFYVPKKRYGTNLVRDTDLVIPINLELAPVPLDGTAEVTLHIDSDEDAVSTFKAYKKHLARIGINKGEHAENFIPEAQNTPFEYELDWHVQ